MNEKRFTLEKICQVADNGNYMGTDEVVDLLNELADENEQLKQENQELRHFKLSIKSFAECNDNINRRTLNDLIGGIDYD